MRNSEEQAVFALRELYRQYGYLPFKMSRFEQYDLYVRNKDYLVSDQIITFSDKNGKLLALKPDVTLSIIKNAPDTPGAIQKVYYAESVYRADPGSHQIKEIRQAGLECVGDLGSYEIAEAVLLAAKSLELLGGNFVLDISHVGLTRAVLDACGIAQEDRKEAFRCLRQKNSHELVSLCTDPKSRKKLELLAGVSGDAQSVLTALEPLLTTTQEHQAMAELESLCGILHRCGYAQSMRVDFSVGNDMKYYSGVVFKGYLEGLPFSILSGGQYDKLLQKMGRTSKAIGFALYLSLLERRDENSVSYDVDTLILHDPQADPERLLALAQEKAKEGSVLVAAAISEGRSYKRLIRFEKGEAREVGKNG